MVINPLNADLNPIRHLLALVAARHILCVSRIRVRPVPVASRSKVEIVGSNPAGGHGYLLLVLCVEVSVSN